MIGAAIVVNQLWCIISGRCVTNPLAAELHVLTPRGGSVAISEAMGVVSASVPVSGVATVASKASFRWLS